MKRIFTFFLVLTMVFGIAYNATAEQDSTDPWARIKELQNEALSSLNTNGKADEENMANINKIEVEGNEYNLKDTEAREAIAALSEEIVDLSASGPDALTDEQKASWRESIGAFGVEAKVSPNLYAAALIVSVPDE